LGELFEPRCDGGTRIIVSLSTYDYLRKDWEKLKRTDREWWLDKRPLRGLESALWDEYAGLGLDP
jgi:hypothetical protein